MNDITSTRSKVPQTRRVPFHTLRITQISMSQKSQKTTSCNYGKKGQTQESTLVFPLFFYET